MSRGFYSLSTPIWINFGNNRGLPISCFNSHISDSIESFLIKQAEVGYMTKVGGGTSGYFGDVRGRGANISTGGKAEGSVRTMELFYNVTNIVSQGNARRGHFAAYLPIEHPDIEEFLKIRSEGHTIQEMSIGVCVSDEFMSKMVNGDTPSRKIWAKVIQKRSETGYPYIFFTDNVNNNAPDIYKDKGMRINSSNMCSEIMLPSSENESFVCNLSSMNLERYDEWKDTDAIETLIYFLDAVMSEFIEKTEDMILMKAPRRFAMNHRALGLGVLGWHSYLQSKMIAFESLSAHALNVQIWKNIRTRTDNATQKLAEMFGEPELLKGTGRRNTTTIAVAPTTSSSFILGQVSPSIEPLNSNYFVKNLAKGVFTYRNPYLEKLLIEKDQANKETWKSILIQGGSVQHLEFLSQDEKDVFKTFGEISQKEIVIQAANRQKYIDQGQSLNLMIPPETTPKKINELMIFAWEQGIKTLYYQRSSNPSQQLARNIMNCKTCES
jgi:ribonucleoside-diphosphate reductase alpha chain